MSVKWLDWAFELPPDIKGSTRLVAITLADCANDQGESWYPIPHLAAKTAMSERSLQRALSALADAGYMTRIINGKKTGTRKRQDGTTEEFEYDADKRPTLYGLHKKPIPEASRVKLPHGRKQETPTEPGDKDDTPTPGDASDTPPTPATKNGTPVEPKMAPRGVTPVSPNPSPLPVIDPSGKRARGSSSSETESSQPTLDDDAVTATAKRLCGEMCAALGKDHSAMPQSLKEKRWIEPMKALLSWSPQREAYTEDDLRDVFAYLADDWKSGNTAAFVRRGVNNPAKLLQALGGDDLPDRFETWRLERQGAGPAASAGGSTKSDLYAACKQAADAWLAAREHDQAIDRFTEKLVALGHTDAMVSAALAMRPVLAQGGSSFDVKQAYMAAYETASREAA